MQAGHPWTGDSYTPCTTPAQVDNGMAAQPSAPQCAPMQAANVKQMSSQQSKYMRNKWKHPTPVDAQPGHMGLAIFACSVAVD